MKIDQLNPKIFDSRTEEMIPKVRERLLEITDEFLGQINENIDINILDIRLVGSNAAFNYTEYSDIDLHLVVDLSTICREHPDIVQYLFNSEKSRFNMNYDISLKGIQVEIYVEDVRAGTVSNGIYSILKNDWIKEPTYFDEVRVDVKATDLYQELFDTAQYYLDHPELYGSSAISTFIDDLYMIRKNSLESEGEYGLGNLVFKQLRNDGLLDELKEEYYERRSKELSLESIRKD